MPECPPGYHCRVALVNLSRLSWEPVELEPEALRAFIGGRGLAVAILYNVLRRDEWPLVAATSPLVGTGLPMANRLTLAFRSPLTGGVAWANTGGYASPALKRAGFDALVLVGRSSEPVYIIVGGGGVSIEDASELWGLDAVEATVRLRRLHGDVRVLAIGPAGERGSRPATVINDTGRSSGVRHGAGWVLGRKRVKALVLAGGPYRPRPADKARVSALSRALWGKIRSSRLLNRESGLLAVYGTPIAIEALGPYEAVPHRNYKTPVFRGWRLLGGRAMHETILASRLTCSACPVSCRRDTMGSKLRFRTEGPDYAQISSLGTNTGLADLEGVAYLTWLSYRLGVDPIEAGNLAAMYLEIAEIEGLEGAGGWGRLATVERLVREMSLGGGPGEVLALGAREASRRLGHPEVSTDVKGVTVQNADPRVEKAWGLINAVESFGGAAHIWVYGRLAASFKELGVETLVDWRFEPLSTARAVYREQLRVAIVDSLQFCAFSSYAFTLEDYSAALSAVTGLNVTPGKLLETAKLVLDLERLVNESLGIGPGEDRLPPRLSEEPVPEGRNKGETLDLEPYLTAYYEERGMPGGRLGSERAKEVADAARALRVY